MNNTRNILIIGFLFFALQGIGQVNPTAAIKPAPGENYILLSKDTFSDYRFVYDSVLFSISNDTLFFTDLLNVDLGGYVQAADGSTITGDGSSGSEFTVDTSLIATQSDLGNINSTNIYTDDGTLTGDRIVTMGGNDIVFNGGNIGIGTATPSQKLNVIGNGLFSSNLYSFNISPSTNTISHGTILDPSEFYSLIAAGGRNEFNTKSRDFKIYSTLQNTSTIPILLLKNETGFAGFGTNNPQAKLHLKGSGSGTGKSFYIENNLLINTFNVLDNGNVGIGVSSPSSKLEVKGDILLYGDDYAFAYSPSLALGPQLSLGTVLDPTSFFRIGAFGGVNNFDIKSRDLRFFSTLQNSSTIPIMFLKNDSGNIGFGTNAPSQRVQISGNLRLTSAFYDSNNQPGTSNQVLSSTGTATDWIDDSNLYISNGTLSGNRTITSTGQYLEYAAVNGSNVNYTTFDDIGNDFALTDGINVSNLSHRPEYLKLSSSPYEVVNNDGYQIITGTNETNATTKDGGFATYHYTNIEEPFIWLKTQTSSSANSLRFGGGDSGGNAATVIDWYTAANNTTTTGTRAMRINSSGNLGIGLVDPTDKLEVDGVVKINDFMKMVPTATVPTSPASGWIYFDDGTNRTGAGLRYYNGSSWVDL